MKDLPQQKYKLFLSSLLFLQIHNLSVCSVIALRLYSLIFRATESIPGVIDDTIISHLFAVYCTFKKKRKKTIEKDLQTKYCLQYQYVFI